MSLVWHPKNSILFFTWLWIALVNAAPQISKLDPTATIASGIVIGTATSVRNQPSATGLVNSYLGIPFASPPVRFAPPTPPQSWSTPLQAKKLPPSCMQQISGSQTLQDNIDKYFNNPGGVPPEESEDCLYLNVYAPQDASPTNLRPVMFWIYGGNLQFGTGSLDYYNGDSFAFNQGVVVVTFNYRTNMFGFSNSPEIPFGSQNSGFLDQRLALTWVQENIAQFGGDPTSVTIFGESAGGESVKQLLANPPHPLPFHAAILESQNTVIFSDGLSSYNSVAANFSCDTAPSILECLRNVPAADIKALLDAESYGFPPVNADGTSIDDVRESISTGKFANVPVFMGTNRNEFRVFFASLGVADGQEAVDAVFDLLNVTSTAVRNSVIAVFAASIADDLLVLADRIGTDVMFTCTTSSIANYLATFGYKVWRYSYGASFPTLQSFPNSGAYHTAEIPQVFGTYVLSNQYGAVTTAQVQLSQYMQGVWAGFAKNPSAGTGWPRVGSALGLELGNIGIQNPTGEKTVARVTADYGCGVLTPLAEALGIAW